MLHSVNGDSVPAARLEAAAGGGVVHSLVTPQVMGRLRSLSSSEALRGAADAYLAECFQRKTPPRASELAANLTVSAHHLSRTFQKLVGTPLSLYLMHGRIAHAKYLLRTSQLSMNEVACAAGFGTRVTFFRAFRRATGVTPSDFRGIRNIK
jgi:transcriptional regulator GlxA family with amidase domain